jgi:hypothetical protein
MPRYAITECAGRFVAGQTNTGVGTVLTLSEKQAEHEVRLGTLVSVDLPKPETVTGANEAPKARTQTRTRKAAAASPVDAPSAAATHTEVDTVASDASE